MRLDAYSKDGFDRGAPRIVEALWIVVDGILISSWLPGSCWRVWLLRLFGATIEAGVVIKCRVRVKFPWRLHLGAHCWLGEGVWIDNLASVRLGTHSCVSQGAYLCTGSHDWNKDTFDLVVAPIEVGAHAWIAERCNVAPGTSVGEGAILAMGKTGSGVIKPWSIYAGTTAERVRQRPRNVP